MLPPSFLCYIMEKMSYRCGHSGYNNITKEEVGKTVNEMKAGETPGSDEFLVQLEKMLCYCVQNS